MMPDQLLYPRSKSDQITSDLQKIRQQNLYRTPRIINNKNAVEIVVDGKQLINFSSNDYLGFAKHPEIRAAVKDAALEKGVGSGASPLICGKTSLHYELEKKLAHATGRDRALLFSCGYMANMGVVQALTRTTQQGIFMDEQCHASIVDGVLVSKAKFKRYQHACPESLRKMLEKHNYKRKLVLTESLFSMDGDIAPLQEIYAVCRDYQACLIVDDAHGFGVLGETGMGSLESFQLSQEEVPLIMATFGKALGVQGAFVAGKEEFVEILVQKARPYIYSTSMTITNVAGVTKALDLVKKEAPRRRHLKRLIAHFKTGANALIPTISHDHSPIQSLVIGSPEKTIELSKLLEKKGVFVVAIRPPTVPRGTSRLRISITADHTIDQVTFLLESLKSATAQLDV